MRPEHDRSQQNPPQTPPTYDVDSQPAEDITQPARDHIRMEEDEEIREAVLPPDDPMRNLYNPAFPAPDSLPNKGNSGFLSKPIVILVAAIVVIAVSGVVIIISNPIPPTSPITEIPYPTTTSVPTITPSFAPANQRTLDAINAERETATTVRRATVAALQTRTAEIAARTNFAASQTAFALERAQYIDDATRTADYRNTQSPLTQTVEGLNAQTKTAQALNHLATFEEGQRRNDATATGLAQTASFLATNEAASQTALAQNITATHDYWSTQTQVSIAAIATATAAEATAYVQRTSTQSANRTATANSQATLTRHAQETAAAENAARLAAFEMQATIVANDRLLEDQNCTIRPLLLGGSTDVYTSPANAETQTGELFGLMDGEKVIFRVYRTPNVIIFGIFHNNGVGYVRFDEVQLGFLTREACEPYFVQLPTPVPTPTPTPLPFSFTPSARVLFYRCPNRNDGNAYGTQSYLPVQRYEITGQYRRNDDSALWYRFGYLQGDYYVEAEFVEAEFNGGTPPDIDPATTFTNACNFPP